MDFLYFFKYQDFDSRVKKKAKLLNNASFGRLKFLNDAFSQDFKQDFKEVGVF